jgi:hypothetical protein
VPSHGRFRTEIKSPDFTPERGPQSSTPSGSTSANVQLVAARFAMVEKHRPVMRRTQIVASTASAATTSIPWYGFSRSPLRGMSQVLDSVLGRLQPLSQRILSCAHCPRTLGRMDPALRLPHASGHQPMGLERVESVRGL